ncbi:MAG: UPF0164 family protein [Bacteroidetes bacterium]|nr:UPF0164 family protein [Bacteroidota bacterium]
MKRFLIIMIIMGSLPSLFSQNSTDALRYSRIIYGGTARFQGLEGAYGAVGADFSAVSTNPAGLGLYNSNEVSFTPLLRLADSKADYNGETNRDNKFNGGMGSLGMVFNIKPRAPGGFKSFNIAFGMNRQNNFSNQVYIQGVNNKNSLLTSYVNTLNSSWYTPNDINNQYPFDIALAYNTDLIFLSDSANLLYGNDAPNGHVIQQKSIRSSGSMNEFEISFAGNFNDRLYIGATIGIPLIRYYETSNYQEINNDTSKVHYFQSMSFDQELQTTGTGINFKLGLIYRPADWIRIGAAIHTPTYYGFMRDNWNSTMTGEFSDRTGTFSNTSSSPLGSNDYQLMTPFRAIGSIAFIIGNFGLISGEYEFVNYSQSRFYGNTITDSVNSDIKYKYGVPLNLRVGTEWRIAKFRVRGGFGYYGSPYQSGINTGEMYSASFGLGYRGKHLFIDQTYHWSKMTENYYMYDPSMVNPAEISTTAYSLITTFGVRF